MIKYVYLSYIKLRLPIKNAFTYYHEILFVILQKKFAVVIDCFGIMYSECYERVYNNQCQTMGKTNDNKVVSFDHYLLRKSVKEACIYIIHAYTHVPI